jgi:hypothetical protein
MTLDKSRAKSCGLLDFRREGNGDLVMHPMGDFVKGTHVEVDRFLGWPNANWTPSSK